VAVCDQFSPSFVFVTSTAATAATVSAVAVIGEIVVTTTLSSLDFTERHRKGSESSLELASLDTPLLAILTINHTEKRERWQGR